MYAFGIILWETLARTAPYFNLGLSMPEVGIAVIMDNLRPAVPQDTAAPPAYVALMRECWAPSPADRPSFTQSTLFPICLCFCRWMEYIHVGSAVGPDSSPQSPPPMSQLSHKVLDELRAIRTHIADELSAAFERFNAREATGPAKRGARPGSSRGSGATVRALLLQTDAVRARGSSDVASETNADSGGLTTDASMESDGASVSGGESSQWVASMAPASLDAEGGGP